MILPLNSLVPFHRIFVQEKRILQTENGSKVNIVLSKVLKLYLNTIIMTNLVLLQILFEFLLKLSIVSDR